MPTHTLARSFSGKSLRIKLDGVPVFTASFAGLTVTYVPDFNTAELRTATASMDLTHVMTGHATFAELVTLLEELIP